MPTYEYACTNCGHVFEVSQGISEKALTRCPKCKGTIRRVIYGGMGVIFKGSGFYTTDYKKSSALTGGNGSSKDGPSREGSASSSSSEKPKEGSREPSKDSKEKAKAST